MTTVNSAVPSQTAQGTMLHLWRVIPIPKRYALTFASTQIKQAKCSSCEN